MKFEDKVGTEIRVGDQIVRAYSIGSSAGLERCIVTGFTKKMMRVVTAEFRTRREIVRDHNNKIVEIKQHIVEPLQPVAHRTIKPGNNVLVVNNEHWRETEEFRGQGLIPL